MKKSLFQRAKTWITRSKTPSPGDDFFYTYPGQSTNTGVKVSEKTALTYLTLFACVSLIAGDLARLPLILYRRRKDGGKDRATDHPLYDILHNVANTETTSFNWREAGQIHCLLWGNHFSFIERNRMGVIKGLWQMAEPSQLEMKRVGGKIVYKYKNGDGQEVVRDRSEIFHVAGFGFNGLYGKSMVTLAREAIGLGLATEQFGAKYFGEGTHPAGALEMDGYLGDKRDAYVKAFKKGYSGLGKSHSVMLLEGGAKYKPMTIPLEDAQFLETRNYQKIEVCGMLHVPPHKVAIHGQNSNYNNLEQENASYVDSCLMHWLVRWESTISHQLLTPAERKSGLFAEFLVDGLLRGDSAARSDYYAKMVANGAMSPNDIRAKENQNPIEGGDQYFIPLNYMTLKQAGEIDLEIKKEPPEIEDNSVKSLRSFFAEKLETRSIIARDRIAKRYYPLIQNALQAIVNKETKAIKAQITKRNKRAGQSEDFQKWLDEFYRTFDEYIKKQASPVFRSFMESIRDEALNEINVKIDDSEIDEFIRNYIDTYATRHIASSTGQLNALNRDKTDEDINQRADEWYETRAEKDANNETVRASNAVYQAVVFAAGMSTILKNRGAKTCPYCKSLAGKRVRKGGPPLVADGGVIEVKGELPMKVRGDKFHVPIHRGCDCYMSIV